ncbi:hypothetical protein QBC41DRAFT_123393 [Cercophora samala]|uniref:Uncharacterized protein n=1 Tax=Cercophora samala TaxID=330535 RepID=A0AA39ZC92_9PEZI|nr:hypothetical protein QBC41DRAFT_123393 [Cercophora samala]
MSRDQTLTIYPHVSASDKIGGSFRCIKRKRLTGNEVGDIGSSIRASGRGVRSKDEGGVGASCTKLLAELVFCRLFSSNLFRFLHLLAFYRMLFIMGCLFGLDCGCPPLVFPLYLDLHSTLTIFGFFVLLVEGNTTHNLPARKERDKHGVFREWLLFFYHGLGRDRAIV